MSKIKPEILWALHSDEDGFFAQLFVLRAEAEGERQWRSSVECPWRVVRVEIRPVTPKKKVRK